MNLRILISAVATLLLLCSGKLAVQAQTIWNGPPIVFTQFSGDTNQDFISPNVWITRGNKKGIYNARYENNYIRTTSPSQTEWAIGALTDYASLTYTDWETCYGGSGFLQGNITTQSAVMHIIPDDIYLGIQFTFWGGSGGGFSYTRTTAPPVAMPVTLTNAILVGTNFQFSYISSAGFTNTVFSATNLLNNSWQTRSNLAGDGSLKLMKFPKRNSGPEFFRVSTQ
jgi:hypothetical protein